MVIQCVICHPTKEHNVTIYMDHIIITKEFYALYCSFSCRIKQDEFPDTGASGQEAVYHEWQSIQVFPDSALTFHEEAGVWHRYFMLQQTVVLCIANENYYNLQ